MPATKKELLNKIARNIESYASYLKETGITEVPAAWHGRGDKLTHRNSKKVGRGVPALSEAEGPAEPSEKTAHPESSPYHAETEKVAPINVMRLRPDTSLDFSDVEKGLKKIAAAVAACKKCVLHEKRNRTVPGQGKPAPDILFIGEGPGEDEDRQGLAFVGRAGQLLTRLIKRMGFTRDEVFIANIVKCRPPNNRKPLPEEMTACLPYLEEQIGLLQPKVIVILGATSLEALISPDIRISRARGKWMEYRGISVMPTFHPSYLLRNQSAMWDVWADMQQVLERLGRPVPAKQ